MNREQSILKLHNLIANKQFVEARNFCLDLTRVFPADTEIWMLRSGMHYQLDELTAVVECCQRIIAHDPNHAGAHCSSGLAWQGLKRLKEAEAAYREALRLDPRYMRALAQLAGLLREQKRFAEMREMFEAALVHLPQDAFLHYNLGLVLVELGDRQKALDSFQAAIALNPRFAEAHYSLGLQYNVVDNYSSAVIHFERAIALNPNYLDARRALGDTLLRMGQPTEAIACYDRALAVAPNDVMAHGSRAICNLLLGNFKQGWPEYEWRLRHQDMVTAPTGRPRWRGEPLQGKTIVLLGEQGMGDTVQFVRYARMVKTRGARVLLVCPAPLRGLLADCAGVDAIFNSGDYIPAYDYEIPLLSLPGVLGTELDSIPAQVPYLQIRPEAGITAVSEIARHTGVLRVGLVWAGGGLHPNNYRRSCKLAALHELLAVPGVRFFSLQKGTAADELAALPDNGIVDLGPSLNDFADTAAASMALDLVISVDTAVAHVAGALARPVWMLLPFAPDWRWMLNREDSPWYPSMRLFRQSTPGDWSSVSARVATRLTALAQERSATRLDRN
ncbi:MAG: tetratricopeptide repeat protein [Gammaproteobacteria bacterium]|nr:tetratricopeptide repeat protein [Gammaproteobacteria bacterium]